MERSVDSIDLFSPVTALKGVGPARARQLESSASSRSTTSSPSSRAVMRTGRSVAIAALEPDVPACFEAMGHLPAHDGLHPPRHGADARARCG